MNPTDLANLRDELGAHPDDDTLEELHGETGHWILTALRVLKRRRADIAGGGQAASSFSLSGVLSVSLGTGNLAALDSQIERLEALWATESGETPGSGVSFGRFDRRDARVA